MTSSPIHTSFSFSHSPGSRVPLSTCSPASRLWSSSGASTLHPFLSVQYQCALNLAIPSPISFQVSDICTTSLFCYSRKRKKKAKPFLHSDSSSPPPSWITLLKAHSAASASSQFSRFPPKPNCQYRCLRSWRSFTVFPSCLPVFICCPLFLYFLFPGLLNT